LDFERISDHIFRMELSVFSSGPFSFSVAVWLIQGDQGWILIDSGPPDSSDIVVAAIARATRGQGPSRVLLTHAHYDHSGGMNAVYVQWQPQIFCHTAEAGYITGERDYRDLSTRNPLFWLAREFIPAPNIGLEVTHELQRGEAIGEMVVIHLPGHTPGHIGFLHSTDQAMICGDAIMNRGGRITPPMRLLTADPKLARASIQRLSELDFKHLLPSHGQPIVGNGWEALQTFLGQAAEPDTMGGW
jgi:glyoxylase-like metal-dependent hydrolase (beta-lactamase superfamily II)